MTLVEKLREFSPLIYGEAGQHIVNEAADEIARLTKERDESRRDYHATQATIAHYGDLHDKLVAVTKERDELKMDLIAAITERDELQRRLDAQKSINQDLILAERDELKADAMRYRWLREQDWTDDRLDAVIDKAMGEGK